MADADAELVDAGAEAPQSSGSASGGAGGSHGHSRHDDRRKGRGTRGDAEADDRYAGRSGMFDSLDTDGGPGPAKSVEGWIIFITGVHEEASEDDVLDRFAEYGDVRAVNVNLDRKSGYTKGYAIVEYATKEQAEAAITGMDNAELLGKTVRVDWGFVKDERLRGGAGSSSAAREGRRRGGGGGGGDRGGDREHGRDR